MVSFIKERSHTLKGTAMKLTKFVLP